MIVPVVRPAGAHLLWVFSLLAFAEPACTTGAIGGGGDDSAGDARPSEDGASDARPSDDGAGDARPSDDGNTGAIDAANNDIDGGAPASVRDQARALAQHLRGHGNFMIGHGNDNSGAYDHDIAIDLHYTYLVGYGDSGGWSTWNSPAGAYVDYRTEAAAAHGVTPMFTYYQLALELETGNYGIFTDSSRMRQYLLDFKLLYQRLAAFGAPAVVTIEPDFFGYLENRVHDTGVAPDDMAATIHFADFHDCDALPETVTGLLGCLVAMARDIAPEVRVGFHASQWGAWYDSTDPDADIEGAGMEVADFLLTVGAAQTDFVAVETLDRDAGFWETSGGGSTCSVTDGPRGPVYWDETNTTLPNFSQHLRWVGAVTERAVLPALWWQTPLGVPSDQCGGTADHWRDNRVHYFFAHIDELVDAGGAGAAFGTGAGGQTTLDTDGDQFKNAAAAYALSPFAL